MATLEQLIATSLMVPRQDPNDPTCVWGLPLNIIGLSGIGKSERVAEACSILALNLQIVFPATKQPEDFSGAPWSTPSGIVMECILPQARNLIDSGSGVLFFDELSTARPAVQAACLGTFNDRRVGDHRLPPKVRVMAAMNPAEYAAGGFVLEAALANRMAHIQCPPPSATDWCDWLTGVNKLQSHTVVQAEALVRKNWSQHWSYVLGLMSGFMLSNPSQLHQQPLPDDPASGGPWASHRTWNWAGRAIATVRCLDMPKILETQFLEACVGKGPVKEWTEWVSKADLPTPIDMLTKGWKPNPARLDVMNASLTSMTTWLADLSRKDKNLAIPYGEAAWAIIDSVIAIGKKDIALRPASTLVTADLGIGCKNVQVQEAAKKILKPLTGFSKYLQATGGV